MVRLHTLLLEAGGGAFQVGDRQMMTLWNRVFILINSPEVVHSLILYNIALNLFGILTANSVWSFPCQVTFLCVF